MANHQLKPTWEPAQVEQVVTDALAMIARVNPPEHLAVPAFQVTFQLLSQRVLVPKTSGIAIAEHVLQG